MDLTLNRDVMNVELSGIRQFTYLVRDTPGACALTIGEPDLNTPDVIKEAAKAALDDNDTHYPPGNGYPYALEAIGLTYRLSTTFSKSATFWISSRKM